MRPRVKEIIDLLKSKNKMSYRGVLLITKRTNMKPRIEMGDKAVFLDEEESEYAMEHHAQHDLDKIHGYLFKQKTDTEQAIIEDAVK